MKLTTLYLPEPYIQALDELVARKLYPNRSECIRFAVRDVIDFHKNLLGANKDE